MVRISWVPGSDTEEIHQDAVRPLEGKGMPLPGCEVVGEIRYGSDLSFEEVGEVEAMLRDKIESLLAVFDPVYVDFRSSGDELGFVSSLRECDSAGLYGACLELASWLDAGALGRLVAVTSGFGPVRVWTFSAGGVDEASVGINQ